MNQDEFFFSILKFKLILLSIY